MNESLSFRTILTKVTFLTTSVANLMLDSTCFVLYCLLVLLFLPMYLSTTTLKHLLHCPKVLIFLLKLDILICQTIHSDFDRLALMLLHLDRELYCTLFLCNQSTFSEINFFIF
jgi:hypothetical protein